MYDLLAIAKMHDYKLQNKSSKRRREWKKQQNILYKKNGTKSLAIIMCNSIFINEWENVDHNEFAFVI